MRVDDEEIGHVAELARIDLGESVHLRLVEALDSVPAVESEPDLVNVLRPDEVESCLDQAEALKNAPETEDGYFKGPRVS